MTSAKVINLKDRRLAKTARMIHHELNTGIKPLIVPSDLAESLGIDPDEYMIVESVGVTVSREDFKDE